MGRSFRRFCPVLDAVASKAMEVPGPQPAGEAEDTENGGRRVSSSSSSSSSNSSSSNGSSKGSSSDENCEEGGADSGGAAEGENEDAAAHAPAGPDPSTAGQAAQPPGFLAAPLQDNHAQAADAAQPQAAAAPPAAWSEVSRIAGLKKATPRRILNLPSRGRLMPKEIRKAYLKLAAAIHPDKCSAPEATQAFQILQAAYDKLSR